MPFKTIDLCAGIGGIRRGFEMTGYFENVLASEIDQFACMTYEHLYHEDAHHDLTTEEFKSLVEQTDYDILLAGFPCQSFSKAGLELGFADKTKGTIFYHIAEIIQRTRPRAIFLENVDNLVRHDKGNTFRVIIDILECELDYKVIGVTYGIDKTPLYQGKDFIRNSKFFGIPQNRPRTYIMAFDRKRYGSDALNNIQDPKDTMKAKVGTCNDAVILMRSILDQHSIPSKIWLLHDRQKRKYHTVLTFYLEGKTVYLELTPQSGKLCYGEEIVFDSEESFVDEYANDNREVIDVTDSVLIGERPDFLLSRME